MDSLTQAVLGAGIQGAMLGRYHGRKAMAAGALLATLPDLDVLIDYGDPISGMIHHRGFSHSLFVLSALALLFTAVWRRWRPDTRYSAWHLFLTLWLVLITHPLLDAFTSYGTQLWWPLKPVPTSWSSIFIIDPFFTLPLLAAAVFALVAGERPRTRPMLRWALGFCVVYLGLSVVAKQWAEGRVRDALARDGQRITAMFSTPQPFTILLWRVLARTDDDHYIEAITSLLDSPPPARPGSEAPAAGEADGPAKAPGRHERRMSADGKGPPEHIKLPLNSRLGAALPPTPQLSGLRWFTDDWLRYDDVDGRLVASDLRMGLGTGYYSFRFLIARRTSSDEPWTVVQPRYWPRDRGMTELSAVIRRIWRQTPALPLATWEKNMTLPIDVRSR